MATVIILGDVHLGKSISIGKSGVGLNLNSRIVDQQNLLDWTIDQAIEKGSDTIIVTGDIFEDPNPHPVLLTIFIAWLKKCQAYQIHVHIIMGNHDCFRSGYVYNSPLDIISEVDLDNVSVYKDINTVLIGSTAFTFLPFRDRKSFNVSVNTEAIAMLRDSLVYELASIPVTYKKVLVGHLAIEGSIPVGDEIDDIANELFCPLEMFKGYDYVWMGHVHKPQVMQKKNPYIAHTGSMDLSNFGESDHKKHIIIVECDGVDKDFIMENLPTRPLRKINIVVPKDTDDTTAYVLKAIKDLKEDFGKAIVKVEVSLSTPELKSVSKSAVDKYLTEQGAFSVASISESKKLNIVKKDSNNTIDTKMDVTSAIKTYAHTYVDDKIRLKFIEFAMQIVADHKAEAKE